MTYNVNNFRELKSKQNLEDYHQEKFTHLGLCCCVFACTYQQSFYILLKYVFSFFLAPSPFLHVKHGLQCEGQL